ncbi:MAG TPA: hypothetical protein PKE29_00020 [Phycisphaerales bacterium]|nr:hypothetical protein [Phycisphaerales bacterium]
MSLRWCVVWFMVVAAGVCRSARGQEPAPRGTGLEARVAHLEARLSGLSPERPREYFELGEEVASEASDESDRRLARQLYVLAYELSLRAARADSRLAPSVCLALAAIAGSDDERRWLGALAETVAPDGAVIGAPVAGGMVAEAGRMRASAASRDPAAFDLATMLGFVRIGEGRRAERLLARPGVRELLDRCDRLLMPGIGGASLVRKRIEDYPMCPQCHNRRYIKDAAGVHLCPTCQGTPGGPFSAMELVGHLRTESVLLSGQQRSWSGQITSDFGAPLRELDASELAATYKVDATRPLWRGGRWAEDATARGTKGSEPVSAPPAPATSESPGAAEPPVPKRGLP